MRGLGGYGPHARGIHLRATIAAYERTTERDDPTTVVTVKGDLERLKWDGRSSDRQTRSCLKYIATDPQSLMGKPCEYVPRTGWNRLEQGRAQLKKSDMDFSENVIAIYQFLQGVCGGGPEGFRVALESPNGEVGLTSLRHTKSLKRRHGPMGTPNFLESGVGKMKNPSRA